MEVRKVTRSFEYNGMVLDDPDPTMHPEEVKVFYANVYPELAQAVIDEPQRRGDSLIYAIHRAVGTKGGDLSPPVTVETLALQKDTDKDTDKDTENKDRSAPCPHKLLSDLLRLHGTIDPNNTVRSLPLSLLP